MAKTSPLRNAQPDTLSVCGKLLRPGQVMTVPQTAIVPRETRLIKRRKIATRPANKNGMIQVVCLLEG